MNILDALKAEANSVGEFLGSLAESDWRRDTRCPPMTVHDLAAHMKRGASRISDMLTGGVVQSEPEVDGETYWWRPREEAAAEGAQIVERAKDDAVRVPPEIFAGEWKREWHSALAEAGKAIDADEVYRNPFGLIRLSEYLRTRHVELVIHHMDLRDALGLDPDPEPDALAVVCDVLAGLLGTDPRRLGMEDVRFALVGTGRAPLDETDREALGPLAEEIPLIW